MFRGGPARVWLLTTSMGAATAVLYALWIRGLGAVDAGISIPWPAIAALFYLSEVYVVHLQLRRNAHTFSLSEVPLVLGLFFTGPAGLLGAQIAGAAGALLISRRQTPMKAFFNIAVLSLNCALVISIFGLLPQGPPGPVAWATVLAATAAGNVVSVLLIGVAMSMAGEPQWKSLPSVLGLGVVVTVSNASLGLVGVTIMWDQPAAVWLLVIPVVTLYLAYRGYSTQRQKHESVEFLYDATRAATRTLHIESLSLGVLEHARHMFSAEIAEIVFFPGPDSNEAVSTTLGPGDRQEVMTKLNLDPTEGVWARVASEGEALLFERPIRNERLFTYFETRSIKDAMVAPLHGESGVIGMMMVANHLGDVGTFDGEDLRLFETLANHAGISLANARLVARLEESLAHLTEMNRLKDDFVAAVSHELRTPLTSIQGYVKTLLRPNVHFDGDEQLSFLQVIDRQSARLRSLIEDLLVVSRLESRSDSPVVGVLSLSDLVQQVVEDLEGQAPEHRFVLEFEDELPVVTSDEGKIRQILVNFADNAVKYSAEGTEVRISGRRKGDGVVLSVTDHGTGIPQAAQERIFDRFYQIDQSSTRATGGTGLGLYISRRFAEALGGRVWLERSDKKGSEFCLWIPSSPPTHKKKPAGTDLSIEMNP